MAHSHYLLVILSLLILAACETTPAPPAVLRDAPSTQSARIEPTPERVLAPDQLFGDLFVRVQMQQVFADGKTFVDMIPKQSAAAIRAAYESQKNDPDFDLKAFVETHFDPPANPSSGFTSDGNRSITEHINALWPVLTRQAGADEGDAGSLIPLPNDYIVPGGRFREVYYWDSYFTLLGLQTAGKHELVRDMVENFAFLIDEVGFIPNGNRTYYLTRSQPPFFVFMVDVLADIEGEDVYREFYPQLEKEYAFWMDGIGEVSAQNPAVNHVVRMPDGAILNRYYDAGDRPRAESYREDVLAIRESGRDSQLVARHLRSGAESGWDYSMRWFADGENISSIVTTDIIPPDLNSLLFRLETVLQTYTQEQDSAYAGLAYNRQEAVNNWLWSTDSGWYEDYNFQEGHHTARLTLAGMYPFFVGLPEGESSGSDAADSRMDIASIILEEEFLAPGGLRSSTVNSGQQWDAPNGWPPLQWISYVGLKRYGYDSVAEDIRRRWMDNNERVYENVDKMVEKYNVEDITLEAGGGEYPVQDGFGWSNGVYLRMSRLMD